MSFVLGRDGRNMGGGGLFLFTGLLAGMDGKFRPQVFITGLDIAGGHTNGRGGGSCNGKKPAAGERGGGICGEQ